MRWSRDLGVMMCVLAAGLSGCGKPRSAAPSPSPPAPEAGPVTGGEFLPPLSELPRLELAWKTETAASGPLSRPTTGHGHVYIVRDSEVQALALASGQVAWKADTKATKRVRVSLIGDRLLATSIDGSVVGLDAKTGKTLWTAKLDCFFLFGLTGHGSIGAGTCQKRQDPIAFARAPVNRPQASGRDLTALDLETGKVLWSVTPPGRRPVLQFGIDEKNCYFAVMKEPTPGQAPLPSPMSATLHAHALASGLKVWSHDLDDMVMSVIAVGGAVVATGRNTYGLDPLDGKSLWRRQGNEEDTIVTLESIDHGLPVHAGLLVASTRSELLGLDPRTGRVVKTWTFLLPKAKDDQGMPARPTNIMADDKRILLLVRSMEMVMGGSGHLLLWEGGPEPRVVQSPVIQEGFALAGELLIVPEGGIKAYSLGRAAKAEVALAPAERVKQVLARQGMEHYLENRGDDLGDLKGLPQLGDSLRAVAADRSSPLRGRATRALRALAEPASISVLISIVDEALPPRPTAACDPPSFRAVRGVPPHKQLQKFRDWRPSKECEAAGNRYQEAQSLRGSAVRALAAHRSTESVRRLAPLLEASSEAEPFMFEWATKTAIYRLLAAVGGQDAEQALAAFDRKRAPSALGWNRLCENADRDSQKHEPGESRGHPDHGFGIESALCGGRVKAGKIDVSGAEPGVWIRRRDGRDSSGPALAFQDGLAVDVLEASARGGKLIAKGQAYAPKVGDRRPWSVEIETKQALADRDQDGISDKTEEFLGTDPGVKDSDGDGKEDGDDPSPLAKAAGADEAEAMKEVLRYTFLESRDWLRVIYVHAPAKHRMEIEGVGGVVLHRDALPDGERNLEGPQLPGAVHVAIDELSVTGDSASARIRKRESGSHGAGWFSPLHLTMRRLGGTWRTTESQNPNEKKKD